MQAIVNWRTEWVYVLMKGRSCILSRAGNRTDRRGNRDNELGKCYD